MSAIDGQSTSRTKLGTVGLVLMIIGFVCTLIALALYLVAFPDQWYALGDISFATSKKWVEAIILSAWGGLLLLLPGTAMFFFGRSAEGKGRAHDRHRVDAVEGS